MFKFLIDSSSSNFNFKISGAYSKPKTDVSFSTCVNDLILVAGRKEDADTLFFQRRLSIEGDTELGLEVKNLLDNIEFDNLPPIAEKFINHFADFVKAGLVKPATKSSPATEGVSA